MRAVLAVALGLSFACASMNSSGSGTAQAQSCSPATTNKGAVVYASPDSASAMVAALKSSAQVCADADAVGFGYRHVKLSDGREGYVAEGDLI